MCWVRKYVRTLTHFDPVCPVFDGLRVARNQLLAFSCDRSDLRIRSDLMRLCSWRTKEAEDVCVR